MIDRHGSYHRLRRHQALFNFTMAHVHEVNNKSKLLQELIELKRRSLLDRPIKRQPRAAKMGIFFSPACELIDLGAKYGRNV